MRSTKRAARARRLIARFFLEKSAELLARSIVPMKIGEVDPHAKVRSDGGRIERERGAELIEALLEAVPLFVAFGAYSFALQRNSDLKVQGGAGGIAGYGREPVSEDGFRGFEVADFDGNLVRAPQAFTAVAAILRVRLAVGFDGDSFVAAPFPLLRLFVGLARFWIGRFAGFRCCGLAPPAGLKAASKGQNKKYKGKTAKTGTARIPVHGRIPTASFEM
jgi:hypothetical protein